MGITVQKDVSKMVFPRVCEFSEISRPVKEIKSQQKTKQILAKFARHNITQNTLILTLSRKLPQQRITGRNVLSTVHTLQEENHHFLQMFEHVIYWIKD